jgi:hypothetical protein
MTPSGGSVTLPASTSHVRLVYELALAAHVTPKLVLVTIPEAVRVAVTLLSPSRGASTTAKVGV